MWEEDSSHPFDTPDEQPREESTRGGDSFPPIARGVPPQRAPGQLPHVVQFFDLYEAARARAIADHQLDKLFNPEYYI
jgi:hypothetical protein